MTSDSESGFMRLQIREGIKPGTEGNETGSNLVLLSFCMVQGGRKRR